MMFHGTPGTPNLVLHNKQAAEVLLQPSFFLNPVQRGNKAMQDVLQHQQQKSEMLEL
jgi:hypothetical protein